MQSSSLKPLLIWAFKSLKKWYYFSIVFVFFPAASYCDFCVNLPFSKIFQLFRIPLISSIVLIPFLYPIIASIIFIFSLKVNFLLRLKRKRFYLFKTSLQSLLLLLLFVLSIIAITSSSFNGFTKCLKFMPLISLLKLLCDIFKFTDFI